MSKLGRKLEDVILLDNSPFSYMLQKENGMPIVNWYDSHTDKELHQYAEILEALAGVPDVREYLPKLCNGDQLDYRKSKEVIKELKQQLSRNGKRESQQNINCILIESEHERYQTEPRFDKTEAKKDLGNDLKDLKARLYMNR